MSREARLRAAFDQLLRRGMPPGDNSTDLEWTIFSAGATAASEILAADMNASVAAANRATGKTIGVKYDPPISVDIDKFDQLASAIATAEQENRRLIAFQWLKANAYFARMSGDQDVERIDALLSALDAVAWQPIATAPKSCRALVCGGVRNCVDGYHDVQAAWIDAHGNVWADDRKEGSAPIRPTHWMTLPGLPK
jgi:hypothetical protein